MAATKKSSSPKKAPPKATDTGPTEGKVDMEATIPQHVDDKGTKVEDEAGTGEIDSPGG